MIDPALALTIAKQKQQQKYAMIDPALALAQAQQKQQQKQQQTQRQHQQQPQYAMIDPGLTYLPENAPPPTPTPTGGGGGGGGGGGTSGTITNVNQKTTPTTVPAVAEPAAAVPDASATTPTAAAPVLSAADYLQMINDLYAAKEKSTRDRLEATLKAGIENLEGAIPGIQQTYRAKKNEAAAQSDIGALNFAQYMAARGIKGSAGGLPEIYRNAALQNALNSLDTAQSQDIAGIERQIATLRNNAGAELDAALADIAMAKAQAEIDARKYLDAQSLQLQQIAKQDEESEYNRRLAVAELTGNYGGMSKWWSQEDIDAAGKRWQTENTPRTTYSGSGSGSKTSLNTHLSIINTILEDSRDPVTGQYTAAGINKAKNYASAYGGEYAGQLLAVIPDAPGSPGTGGGGVYSALKGQAASMIANDADYNAIADMLAAAVDKKQITEAEARQIMRELGLIP
jgi:hypothetical protein